MSTESRKHLSSTQRKVKQPRRCIYDGEHQNTDKTLARDILSLYITCKLGYSAIRHILGLPNDKKIEDVVRQHMVGRKGVDGAIGELQCPGSTTIEESYKTVVEQCMRDYKTQNDPYNVKMMTTGKWEDDPVAKKITTCAFCGKELEDSWVACPYCGKNRDAGKQKNLF
jgi:hypothetical protein